VSSRKLAVTVIVAAGVALAAPATALGQFELQNVSAQPADTQAGANSDFTIALGFAGADSADSVRDLTVHLPPGLIGNPLATSLCSVDQLNANACDPATQVGSVVANVDLCIPLIVPLCVPNPLPINGAIYNLEPQPGEPARFGIVLEAVPFSLPVLGDLLLPPIIQQSAVVLRKDDLGLDTVLKGTPNTATVIDLGGPNLTSDIRITSLEITLSGMVGGKGFMRNPTSCREAVTRFDATSHSDETASAKATFTPTGCENLPFKPAFSATIGAPGQTTPASKPPLTTVIQQTFEEAGLRRAEVILPPGVGADNAALVNQCSTPDFAASACPENTRIGTARAESPVQATPLTGWVAVVEPLTPGLPNLGLDLQGALPLQLRGNFVLSPGPGNVFEGLPDIPISRFELGFDQGELVSISRNLCEPPLPLFTVTFDGHNGAHVTDQVPATVVGCGGKGKPTARVNLSKKGSEHPRMRVNVTAGFSPISEVKVKLPKALRLARGNEFEDGTKVTADGDPLSDSVLGGKRRKLTVDAGTGAAKLKVRAAGESLERLKEIDGKLPFKIKVDDLSGERTKLKAKA
jgi:hypothetical protein